MRPERKREHLESTGLARARMYIKAHLSWLDGWPVAQSHERVEWQIRPAIGNYPAERIVIDRERLRQTQSIFLKLLSHFPKALPKAVGNVTAWRDHVTFLLERLKQAIHRGEDILSWEAAPWETLSHEPLQNLGQLVRARPSLSEAARALLWSGTIDPTRCEAQFAQLAAHADSFNVLIESNPEDKGIETALLLVDLGCIDGDAAAKFPLMILGNRARQSAIYGGLDGIAEVFVTLLKQSRSVASLPTKPIRSEGPVARVTIQFVTWLCNQKPAVRQRAVRLLDLTPLETILDEWITAWDLYIDRSHQTLRHLRDYGKQAFQNQFVKEVLRLANELDAEFTFTLDKIRMDNVLNEVRRISESFSPALFDSLCRFLAAVPINGAPCLTAAQGRHLRLVTRRETAHRMRHKFYERSQTKYLILAADYFERHLHHSWCALPWDGLLKADPEASYFWQSPCETMMAYLEDERRWPIFFEAISQLAPTRGYRFQLNDDLGRLCAISKDTAQVCRRFVELTEAKLMEELDQRHFAIAAELECNDAPFIELCHMVKSMFDEAREISATVAKLARHVREAGWPELLPSIMRQKRTNDVARMSAQCAALGSEITWPNPIKRPALTEPPEWARPLPTEWHPTIATFCRVAIEKSDCSPSPGSEPVPDADLSDLDARKAIERILTDVSPSRERLEHEIAALEQRVEVDSTAPHLQRRLNNLRERRDNPLPIPSHVRTKYRRKLEEALTRFVFDDLRQRVEQKLTSLLVEKTGNRQIRRHITSSQHLELIRALLRLKDPYRSLGLRLLKKSWCGIDWKQEDEPANRSFVDSLSSRGIRFEPWLSAEVFRSVTLADGRTITMSFERDEVQKLLMGYHFDTCLSTDGVNFFSAVVNSVDINKQVLYARDARHQVVGRCLFALGDAGSIMTFHPYCHETSEVFPFAEHVGFIATELAHRMNTLVSSSDHVSPLVAPDWYNDGPLDQGDSINLPDSPLRQFLKSATEETLLSGLEKTLGPIGLSHTALALLVELPDFEERPELVRPLLPLLDRCEAKLNPMTLVTVAYLARKANENEYASRMFTARFTNWLQREVRRTGAEHFPASRALDVLAEYRPTIVLNILHQTRDRRVHDDLDESSTARLELLKQCHQRLGRLNLAAALQRKLES